MWTLDSALDLVRRIQLDAWRAGYFLALGGGVLNRGASEKDLDIVCMPQSHGDKKELPALLAALRCAGFTEQSSDKGHTGVTVYKLNDAQGRQIDLIVPILTLDPNASPITTSTAKPVEQVRASWMSGR